MFKVGNLKRVKNDIFETFITQEKEIIKMKFGKYGDKIQNKNKNVERRYKSYKSKIASCLPQGENKSK